VLGGARIRYVLVGRDTGGDPADAVTAGGELRGAADAAVAAMLADEAAEAGVGDVSVDMDFGSEAAGSEEWAMDVDPMEEEPRSRTSRRAGVLGGLGGLSRLR